MPQSQYAKTKEATERLKEFTGHAPDFVDYYDVDPISVAFKIGTCDGILYTTVRDGVKESYIHKFRKKSRPLLVSSHDGKQIMILGGGYNFTERGIVDK